MIVSDVNELYGKDLHGFQLVWFETTGNKVVDSEVIASLKQFLDRRKHTISSKFKVIIMDKPISENKDVGLAIMKKDDLKTISLSKYLSHQNP